MAKRKVSSPSREEGGGEARHDLRLVRAIRRIIRAIDIDSRQLAARHEITGPQLLCLITAVERGPVTAKEIADQVHVSPSTVVGILDRLEGKGLVERERDTRDRRLVFVTATAAGTKLVRQTPYPLQDTLARALEQMSPQDREQTTRAVEHLVDVLGASDEEPDPLTDVNTIGKLKADARHRTSPRK